MREKTMLKKQFAVAVCVALMLAALSNTVYAQTSYSVTLLGTLCGDYSRALGVNNWGHVVGDSFYVPGGTSFGRDEHAFYWANGVMRDLGTLGGTWSTANAINNSDEVVGRAQIPVSGNSAHAFIWDSTNGMRNLNAYLLPADAANWILREAYDINDYHQVVGWGQVLIGGVYYVHGFLFDLNTSVITDLGTLPGASDSRARGMNNLASPQVVGNSSSAFLYNGVLPLVSLSPMTNARGINNAGEIVGSVGQYAAYRSPSGVITNLGAFTTNPYASSEAISINNASPAMVVGKADTQKGTWILPRAFRWQVGSAAKVDLNTLTSNLGKKWLLLQASKISDNGFIAGIAGQGNVGTSYLGSRAFLLTPQ